MSAAEKALFQMAEGFSAKATRERQLANLAREAGQYREARDHDNLADGLLKRAAQLRDEAWQS